VISDNPGYVPPLFSPWEFVPWVDCVDAHLWADKLSATLRIVRSVWLLWSSNKQLSWKCRFFRCRPQLVLKTYLRVFPTRRPDTADVSATSCDVGFFFSVSYVVSLPNCRLVVVRSNYSLKLSSSHKSTRVLVRVNRQNFGSGNGIG
jgi:hypothetical protein